MGWFGELLALAPAALLCRAGPVVDDDGGPGGLAERPLHRVQLAPVVHRSAGGKARPRPSGVPAAPRKLKDPLILYMKNIL